MDRYRRIPLTGHFPFISTINDPRTTIGPMARFVEDLALALPIISGMDWQDASVIPMPLADWRAIDVGSLRVAYYTYHAEAEPTRETAETCRLTGWPCVVVRAGTAPDGLPIGVQIVVRPWRDDVALAAAQAIEGALGGWQPPPLNEPDSAR